ncbi:MAG TPA: hypothetical protein PL029_05925 [Bacteroidia bacterium]|nr:hypothetical protein [Bacteroidia bacterium]
MKRFIAIPFLLLYIFTATECKQLFKFPVLLEHFAEHVRSDHNISFLDFLSMHYVGYDFNDNDEDRDMQLPFKSCGGSVAIDTLLIPSKAQALAIQVFSNSDIYPTIYKRLNFQSVYCSAIWQPPKTA